MRTRLSWLVLTGFVLTGLVALAPIALAEDCDFTADREASIDLSGATLIEIDAAAGELKVMGRSGLAQVRVQGEACASSKDLLEGIQIVTKRSGDKVRIIAEIPEAGWSLRSTTARLNLKIEVPNNVALRIDDSSGAMELSDIAAAEVEDSSGEIVAKNIGGRLKIDDSSGSIRVTEVDGDVIINDGSGSIDLRGVRGSVMIDEDGSGSIEIVDVDSDVMVREDGSGSIRVKQVGGDFTVRRDGSGGIDYHEVGGRVDVPARD